MAPDSRHKRCDVLHSEVKKGSGTF